MKFYIMSEASGKFGVALKQEKEKLGARWKEASESMEKHFTDVALVYIRFLAEHGSGQQRVVAAELLETFPQ